MDPQASEVLVELWVALQGVPSPLRHVDKLMAATREIGRPIVVDKYSLINPTDPLRMKFDAAPLSTYRSISPSLSTPKASASRLWQSSAHGEGPLFHHLLHP
jgi:hypothetical protein